MKFNWGVEESSTEGLGVEDEVQLSGFGVEVEACGTSTGGLGVEFEVQLGAWELKMKFNWRLGS